MSNISRFLGNERGDKSCHEDDGCPTELAVLKRFWREQQASTLPEEVANLVELLDEEEVPYEDSLGVALSLTGRTKQYANGKTATLREQVEKLTKERDWCGSRNWMLRSELAELDTKLAAIAEQNEKMRAFVTKISEQTPEKPDYWSSCGQCEHNSSNAEDLLELPNLATPVLNKYRAEGIRMAASFVRTQSNDIPATGEEFAQAIDTLADELENSK